MNTENYELLAGQVTNKNVDVYVARYGQKKLEIEQGIMFSIVPYHTVLLRQENSQAIQLPFSGNGRGIAKIIDREGSLIYENELAGSRHLKIKASRETIRKEILEEGLFYVGNEILGYEDFE